MYHAYTYPLLLGKCLGYSLPLGMLLESSLRIIYSDSSMSAEQRRNWEINNYEPDSHKVLSRLATYIFNPYSYRTLPCKLCATKFSKTLNLNIQVRALHNIITEMCMFCQKHFLQPSQIIDHFESFSSSMQWL